jgi:hypothetical protein
MNIIETLSSNDRAKCRAKFKQSHIPESIVEGEIYIEPGTGLGTGENTIYMLQNEIDGNDARDKKDYECSFAIAYHNDTDKDIIDNDEFSLLEIEVDNEWVKLIATDNM